MTLLRGLGTSLLLICSVLQISSSFDCRLNFETYVFSWIYKGLHSASLSLDDGDSMNIEVDPDEQKKFVGKIFKTL